MVQTPADMRVRVAGSGDIAAVDALLARSYPALLKHDYAPSIMVTAVPVISRAQPQLVTCGTYYVVEDEAGATLGAGGWTSSRRYVGHYDIRHVVTDHRAVRRGVGTALMSHIFAQAAVAGHVQADCLATRTAVPFYKAMGFEALAAVAVPLQGGLRFPAVQMRRRG